MNSFLQLVHESAAGPKRRSENVRSCAAPGGQADIGPAGSTKPIYEYTT